MTRETQSKLLGEFYAEKKNILKLKGEDYANEDVLSNFKTAGANIGISAEQQCLSLIATKVARLGNLLSGKTPNNESVSDSILDLSNYTDLLYCLVNETENVYKNKYAPLYESILSESVLIGVNPNQPTNKEKPKGILSQIKEEDIFYKGGEPIKEPYEPKVGDRFQYNNESFKWEIESLDYNSVIIKLVGSTMEKRYNSHQAFISDIENGTLEKIN